MRDNTQDSADSAPADFPNWRRLGLELILRAVLDARKGDPAARAWLIGADGHAWADLLELPAWPPALEPLQPHKASPKNGAATLTESGGRAKVGAD